MKLIIGLLAAAGLSGCVAYPAGYGASGAYYGNGGAAYYGSEPVFIDGSIGYSGGYRDRHGYRDGRGYRDRDRDGVPNRVDRDRDGDGVRNRADAFPNDPRRR
jgi:hypothetical protein